mmetsp:Transcript_19836/g.27897  ORF Transcript_19836/g.27897 Transcript_19836/m.27897 type:complete len:252 (+) Transcript_19836:1963-2718(+)
MLGVISSSALASTSSNDESYGQIPKSKLDSHTNMVLLEGHAFIFDGVCGRTCTVQPYNPSLGALQRIPIVDVAVAYDDPHTQEIIVLIARNALHVPTLDHNLIPPFIMREAGIIVNDTAKIHVNNPTSNDHALIHDTENLKIPLQLDGIFSFFHTRTPTSDKMISCRKIIITPDGDLWNLYSDHYAKNEECMLDWEGNMLEEHHRKKHNPDEYYSELSSITISNWNLHVDRLMSKAFKMIFLQIIGLIMFQ